MLIAWFLFALPVWAITSHFLVLRERRQAAGVAALTFAWLALAIALALPGHGSGSEASFERLEAEFRLLMLVMAAALLADLVAIGWWLRFLVRRGARD